MIPGVLLLHGDFAWDPSLFSDPNYHHVAGQVLQGSRQAAASFDTTITRHLHSIPLLWWHPMEFGIYLADFASGCYTIGRDLIPPMAQYIMYRFLILLDRNRSQGLVKIPSTPQSKCDKRRPYVIKNKCNNNNVLVFTPLEIFQHRRERERLFRFISCNFFDNNNT